MTEGTTSNALEVTVSELSGQLKRAVEDQFGNVRVRGELGRISRPGSGHIYLDLKDDRAVIAGVIWRGTASRLKHQPEEGLEVIASGKLTTYPGQSKYQIVIDQIEPAGAGALMALLEERRKKLGTEGLFDEERKRELPYMPKVIGVVTSPTGAVIRDILHRIADRFPVHVLVWPVRVQGESSGAEVANGVHRLNALAEGGPVPQPDLIIVARGGGSIEDLWGFNDEAVVRSIAASNIPVISAVGHETDWTLCDLVADWRAPTPTAAAERAVPVQAELEAYLADLSARLKSSMRRNLDRRLEQVKSTSRGLASPDMLLAIPRRRFDEVSGLLGRVLQTRILQAGNRFQSVSPRLSPLALRQRNAVLKQKLKSLDSANIRSFLSLFDRRRDRFQSVGRQMRIEPTRNRLANTRRDLTRTEAAFGQSMARLMEERKENLESCSRLLGSLSYKNVLKRGYAVIRNDRGEPVRLVSDIASKAVISIEMQDGVAAAILTDQTGGPVKKTKPASGSKADDQGHLF